MLDATRTTALNLTAAVAFDMTVPTPEITPLPTAMTAAAFVGIAWYLCAELNVRLLVLSTRRSLYFWACLLCSWGIIIHMLFILLDDFKLWASYGAIVIIHLTWFTFVVSQSIVLYSRLNLVLPIAKEKVSNYILYMIITTSVCFGLSTVILGLCAVSIYSSIPQPLLTFRSATHQWHRDWEMPT